MSHTQNLLHACHILEIRIVNTPEYFLLYACIITCSERKSCQILCNIVYLPSYQNKKHTVYITQSHKYQNDNRKRSLSIKKSHFLQIEATKFAVKSLSSQWLSTNLRPSFFATRQVNMGGIS